MINPIAYIKDLDLPFGKELIWYFFPYYKESKRQIAYKLSFFILTIVFVWVSAHYMIYFGQNNRNAERLNEARQIWYDQEAADSVKFSNLKKENPDFCGWVAVAETNIDNPIYKTADDSYYLSHSAQKKSSRHGEIFVSADDNILKSSNDKNLVLYGHTMKDSSMFTDLKAYRDISFWKKNPTVSLSLSQGNYIYAVFAVYLFDASPEDGGYSYDIRKSYFKNEKEFSSWVKDAQAMSLIKTGIDVQYGDDILTLVTEADDFDDARLVVAARRIRHKESNIVNTSQAEINSHPRYPKAWYLNK